jgi:hypothetical protein
VIQQHQQHGDPTQIINPMFSHKALFFRRQKYAKCGDAFSFRGK